MSIFVGDIDIPNTLINSELRIGVLEKMVERLTRLAPNAITQEDVDTFRNEVFEELRTKYPNAGLKRIAAKSAK